MTVQAASMHSAAEAEFHLSTPTHKDNCRYVDVSVDGTWMTKGHSSKIGVTSAIGCVTG